MPAEGEPVDAPLLGLPAPPPGEERQVLDVSTGGASISLTTLGPVVVGVDGTLARIGNWAGIEERGLAALEGLLMPLQQ